MLLFIEPLRYIPYGLAACLIFMAAQSLAARRRKERVTPLHWGVAVALGLSLTVIFAGTVSPVYGYSLTNVGQAVNLRPFAVLRDLEGSLVNLWVNLLLFVPVGALPLFLWQRFRKAPVAVLTGAALSAAIETLQLFCARAFDIDDIILNTVGTAVGFLIGRAALRKVRAPGLAGRSGWDGFGALAGLTLAAVFAAGLTFMPTPQAGPQETVPPGLLPPQAQAADERARIAAAEALAALRLEAKNVCLIEIDGDGDGNGDDGEVLFEKDSDAQIAPASTVKMLTALTALDCCRDDDPDDAVTVGREVGLIAPDASRAWLSPGDKLTVRQLLEAMLIPSGNDAAYALAVFAGRKLLADGRAPAADALAAFMAAMNDKAGEVGAASSHFVTPDGYDAAGQYTTAADLAQIAKAFLAQEELREIAAMGEVTQVFAGGRQVRYESTNALLDPAGPWYDERVTGLKTGTSKAAGCCLVSCAEIDGKRYIAVVMGSTEEGRWEDTQKLYAALE
ncbi:MAG TPA: VanZ family protein [Candidatus Acidoferrum sp.]|nr:VanZ family protein [Candidatus Acidoferrum sp.]